MRLRRYKKELIIGSAFVLVMLLLVVIAFAVSDSSDPTGQAIKDTGDKMKKVVSKGKEAVKHTVDKVKPECKAVICYKDDKEFYCKDSFADCSLEFDDQCRIVWCEDSVPEEDSGTEADTDYETAPVQVSDDSFCDEEYNACFDGDEEIICHGSFEDCAEAFDDCTCGSDGESYEEDESTLDFREDSSESARKNADCPSQEFLCEKVSVSMDGTPSISTVECKSSYADCASRYGECKCANLTTSWYTDDNPDEHLCDWRDHKVDCNRLEGECEETRNICENDKGVLITCDGFFDYCNEKFDDKCICGIETIS